MNGADSTQEAKREGGLGLALKAPSSDNAAYAGAVQEDDPAAMDADG